MLIESLAQKTRLAMVTVLATIGGCAVICGFTVWCCISLVNKEREQIYILDGDIPFLAERAQLEANFTMEAQAHIQLFHQYFFNLPPDNDYIKWTLGKAMYMADGTALKQKPEAFFGHDRICRVRAEDAKQSPRIADYQLEDARKQGFGLLNAIWI